MHIHINIQRKASLTYQIKYRLQILKVLPFVDSGLVTTVFVARQSFISNIASLSRLQEKERYVAIATLQSHEIILEKSWEI